MKELFIVRSNRGRGRSVEGLFEHHGGWLCEEWWYADEAKWTDHPFNRMFEEFGIKITRSNDPELKSLLRDMARGA